MRTYLLPAVLLAAFALSTPAAAQQKAGPVGERLLMMPPAGWQNVPVQKTEKMAITRLYPPGQGEKKWSEMITVQIYPGSDQSPRSFMDSVIAFSRANCEAAGAGPVTEAPINGYPAAIVTISCTKGKASGQGNVVLVTTIKGRDALYVVQRQWRGAPFSANEKPAMPDQTVKEWNNFPRTIGLCDTRDPKHPCP